MSRKFTISFAYTILFALVMAAVAGNNQDQHALAQNQTYQSYYPHILDYCFNRTEKILAGYNPLGDLVRANLIPKYFENMTCGDISNEALRNSTAFSKPEQ